MRGEADWLLLFGSGCYRRELLERRDRPHLEAFDRRRRLGQYYAGIHRFAYAGCAPSPTERRASSGSSSMRFARPLKPLSPDRSGLCVTREWRCEA
jgi:hypothetical protein